MVDIRSRMLAVGTIMYNLIEIKSMQDQELKTESRKATENTVAI